ncbi:MAG: histidine phosphatase family protein [Planctomycetaceae bacterium]|nr:histidine phosphatase family protein [Planctomycetaceae bacterium]
MKSLLLLRHAKSSWDHPELADHDRPLKQLGIEAAKRMGRWTLAKSLIPDRVLCSSAARTTETWDRVRSVWERAARTSPEVTIHPELYACSTDAIRRVIAEFGRSSQSVMVIGHNPALQDLLSQLTGVDETFPTAAFAKIDLPIDDWVEIQQSDLRGNLFRLQRPRDLDEADR